MDKIEKRTLYLLCLSLCLSLSLSASLSLCLSLPLLNQLFTHSRKNQADEILTPATMHEKCSPLSWSFLPLSPTFLHLLCYSISFLGIYQVIFRNLQNFWLLFAQKQNTILLFQNGVLFSVFPNFLITSTPKILLFAIFAPNLANTACYTS